MSFELEKQEMATLNKALLFQKFTVPAVKIPKTLTGAAKKQLTPLKLERVSCIRASSVPFYNLILLKDAESAAKDATSLFFLENKLELEEYSFTLDYDYYSTNQVLKAILPEGLVAPSSFECVGHIAHLNLGKEYDEHKKLIAEVILDKTKSIKTIVNKTDNIHHTYRFFSMELLAGVDDMLVTDLKESSCLFSFDFSRVYWNSRLQYEHERLVSTYIKPGQAVCDVMAGIGPFSIPTGKVAGALVLANDLNPASHEFLVGNIERNRVDGYVRPYNLDAREFIQNIGLVDLNNSDIMEEMTVKRANARAAKAKSMKKKFVLPACACDQYVAEEGTMRTFDHYIMNLPGTAIEFLDSFKGLYNNYKDKIPESRPTPMVHCYAFSNNKIEDAVIQAGLLERCAEALGCPLDADVDLVELHHVRNVAPAKSMYCISFRVPKDVLYWEEDGEKAAKKAKIEI